MFRLTFRAGWLGLVSIASFLAAAAQTNPPPSSDNIVILHDVVTGKGGAHDLHAEVAYLKKSSAPLPAVILIHGGGFLSGSPKDEPYLFLAKSGYFAAAIEYRLSGEAKWPAQIQDCKLAVRWLRANAAKYNVDPNRIGVWGQSAGGHLVACVGTMANVKEFEGDGGYPGVSSAVQAVVDFYGPVDFTHPEIYGTQTLDHAGRLFGVPLEQNPALWKSGSPLYSVAAGDPPVLIVQGSSDTQVLPVQSTNFADALTKAGVPNQLMMIKNAGHSFKPDPGAQIDPSRNEINKAVLDFFGKYLGAASRPASSP